MTQEQAQQVLDELGGVRPEMLTGEGKKLFEAIMKIADERDELIKENKKINKQIDRYQNMLVTNDMLHIFECEHKNEIIDLMSEMINNNDIDEDICKQMGKKENCNEFTDKENCKVCIKQYFENKTKEV